MHELIVALLVLIIVILVYMMYSHKCKNHCVPKPPAGTATVSVTPSAASSTQPISANVPANTGVTVTTDAEPAPPGATPETFSVGDLSKNMSNFSGTLQRKIMGMGGAGENYLPTYNPGVGTFLAPVYHRTSGVM